MATIKFQGTMKELAEYAASCDPNIFVLLEYNTDEDCDTYVEQLKEEGLVYNPAEYDDDPKKAEDAVKMAYDYLSALTNQVVRSGYNIYNDIYRLIINARDGRIIYDNESMNIINTHYNFFGPHTVIDQLNIIFNNVSHQSILDYIFCLIIDK